MVMFGTRFVGGVYDGIRTNSPYQWQSGGPTVDTGIAGFASGQAMHIVEPADGSSAPVSPGTAPTGAYQRIESLPTLAGVTGVTDDGANSTFGTGFTGFFGMSVKLDTDFPVNPLESGGGQAWQLITQWKNDDTGSPPVELKVTGGKFKLDGNSGGWSVDICPAVAGQQYNILVQLTFTESATTSTANVWVNGTQYLTNFHPTGAGFLYTGQRSYWKVGVYRETGLPAQARASIWYGALCFDTTQATAQSYLDATTNSPLIGTLTDSFTGTTLAAGWTANGAGVQNGSAYVNVSQNAGTAVFSSLRRSDGWTWSGSAIAFYNVVVPALAGDTANAQWWMMDPAPAATVDRAGWEYVAATNQLIARSQTGAGFTTTNYATLTHDPVAHRNLRLTHTGTSVLFETSPDGLSWTTQGTWATPATWTTKTTLRPSIEGSRTTGTNDTSRTGAINIPPAALTAVPPTGADALQRRTLTEVRAWKSWLSANSARGWVGEFGWVTLSSKNGDTSQGSQWAALGEVYETELDVSGLSGTVWASGREWGQGYPLGVHVGVNVGDPLTIANIDAATVVANHPTRGAGTATRWRGVSVSGWEQGININGGGTVRSGAGYLHTAADFGFLAANGVDTVRLPVAWERLQPTLAAALDTTALANLDTMLLAARQVGLRVVIDLHNYGRYTNSDGSVVALGGSLTNAQFTDFWTRLSTWVRANATRSGTVIGYGLMNEVHDLTGGAATWQTSSQAAVTAIRGGGDTRLLLVGGYAYSSLTGWTTNHASGWITDSAANFVYEAHHYWDTQSALGSRSGTYQQSASGPIETYAIELAAAQAAEPATTGGTITPVGAVQTAADIPATAGGYTYGVTSFTTGSTWELLVAKTGTSDANLSITGITGGGLTWTSQVNVAGTAGTNSPVRLWTAYAPPGTAVNAIVSITNATAVARAVSTTIERYSNATLAATPAISSVTGSATPSSSITTTGTNSIVTWVDTDWNHSTTGTATFLSSATEVVPRYQPGSLATWYNAYQRVASPGAVTYGMSAPTGQKASMAAIELQSLPVARRNLLANPALAVDATGWVSSGAAGTTSRVAVTGMDRPWAFQLTQTATGVSTIRTPAVAVPAGQVISGTVQWRYPVVPAAASVYFYYLDVNGALISTSTQNSILSQITAGVPGRTTVTGTTPANTTSVLLLTVINTSSTPGSLVATAARIEQVNDPGLTYADGGTTNWAWDGTAGASTSTLVGQATTLDVVTETETTFDVTSASAWPLDLAIETEEAVDYNQIDYALEVEQAPDVTAVGVWDLDVAVETEDAGGDVEVVWVWPLDVAVETDTVTLLWYDTVLDVATEREIPPTAKQPRRPYIPGSARIKGMRVIAQQIIGGKFLDWELPVADLSITHTLSGPQAITGNLRPHLPRVAELAMTPWNTWLHCEDDDGIIRASGILVTPFGVNEDQRTIECTGVSAVPNSVPFDGSYQSYSADPLDVVRMLWQHVQSYANGNLGVTVSNTTSSVRIGGFEINTATTTGPRVDGNTGGDSGNPYEIAWWDQTICGAEIDNLAKNVPFDYAESQAWKPDYSGVDHHIELGWPRAGTKRVDLRFMQGENIIGAVPVNEIDDSYVTDVIVTGAGEGVSQIVGRASRLGTQVRRVAFLNEKTCKSNLIAKYIAEAELRRRTSPRGIDTLLIDAYHQNAPYGSFQVGDDIFVQATVDWVGDIAMWHRVMEYTYTPDESAISLKLKPSDSFRYGASV